MNIFLSLAKLLERVAEEGLSDELVFAIYSYLYQFQNVITDYTSMPSYMLYFNERMSNCAALTESERDCYREKARLIRETISSEEA